MIGTTFGRFEKAALGKNAPPPSDSGPFLSESFLLQFLNGEHIRTTTAGDIFPGF
jgi:hypothetical protein